MLESGNTEPTLSMRDNNDIQRVDTIKPYILLASNMIILNMKQNRHAVVKL